MKWKLVKCAPRAYSELIRSDIPGSSGARPARLPFLRSSPFSVMPGGAGKEEEERETETFELARGLPSYSGQDPKGGGLSLAFVRRRDWRLFGGDEPPLEVLPILVWSPTSRGAAPPPTMSDEATGNCDRP